MRSNTDRVFFYCAAVVIVVAISTLFVVKRGMFHPQIDSPQYPGQTSDKPLEHDDENHNVVHKRPRNATPPVIEEDRHAEEYRGRTEATSLLNRHLKPAELESELIVLKEKLSVIAFGKLMVGISTSESYSSAEKARFFNVLLPDPLHPKGGIDSGPLPYTVYNDVFRDWGNLPENHDSFLDFIDELNSPEIQEILTSNFLKSNFSDLESFAALVTEESDLSKPSYLGTEATSRVGNLERLMESMISSGKYSAAEIEDSLEKLEIDPSFKNGLVKELYD
jgi:hypothetical protein